MGIRRGRVGACELGLKFGVGIMTTSFSSNYLDLVIAVEYEKQCKWDRAEIDL